MAGARMAGDITLEKEIPYNLDAERAVLGAIMVVNSAMNAAQEFLKDTDFYRDQHRRVYKAMSVLSERASAIDPITVVDELRRTGELEVVGGHAWVVSLIDGVPHSANIEHYAKIVKQQSIRRALIEAGGKIVETAYDGSDTVEDLLDQSERLVFQIAQDQLRGGFVPMSILAEEGLRTIERLQTQRSNITGLATGYGELDEKTSGFQPGDLIIVAARPSMGKTAFAMNIAQNCANTEHATDWMGLMVGQVENAMGYYASIADNYRIAGATTGVTPETSASEVAPITASSTAVSSSIIRKQTPILR